MSADGEGPAARRDLAEPESVFDGLPHGALVLDADGGVLALNVVAARLLGTAGRPAEVGERCCALLGCGARGTRLESGCLARAVDPDGELTPEFRVDLPPGATAGAAWITARRLADGRIVVQARAGRRDDRRRRMAAAWSADAPVAVRALGRTEVEVPGAEGDQAWVGQRAGQLLKLLVAERWSVVTVDEIAEALWPGSPSGRTTTVRALVHHLRQRLDVAATEDARTCIVREGGGYRLRAARVAVDADDFEAAARAGLDAAGRGRGAGAGEPLERAMTLYRGHFLADQAYAEWALPERERLRAVAGEVARALVDLHVREGRLDAAADSARRLAEIDPFDGDAQRRVVALSLLRGRRSEAVRRYEAIRERMLRHFGEAPDFTLLDVADPGAVWPGVEAAPR